MHAIVFLSDMCWLIWPDGVAQYKIGGQYQNKPEECNEGVDRIANRIIGKRPKVSVVVFKERVGLVFSRGAQQYIEEIKHLPGVLPNITPDIKPGAEALN